MKDYIRNRDVCRRSLLMQRFLASQEHQPRETLLESHLCCDVCAKTCRCLCLCKSVCTCDIVCNSEAFFSPMEANSGSASVKMTLAESGSANQSLSAPNKQVQVMQKQFHEELMRYRSKLALEILFFHDPTMLRALGGKLSEENRNGGKRGGFASYHKLKIVQRCVKIREGEAETNLLELRC